MNFEDVVNQDAIRLSSEAFDGANWSLTDEVTSNLMKKISTSTIFLKDYLGVEVRRGIITGLSEAFILDKSKKDELVAADVNSEDLIVPFAVGDDIRKYEVRENGRFLILTKIGIEIEKYPAIFRHLQQYEKQLKKRWDKGNHWWELRACAYYDVFEKPKIIYPDIAKESRMTFVEEPLFVANTAYVIPTDDKYLLAILNSRMIYFYYSKIASVLGDAEQGGRLRWFTQDVVNLPIKDISIKMKTPFIEIVDQILELKKTGGETTGLERRIDEMVYDLYGLTAEEIAIVEGA